MGVAMRLVRDGGKIAAGNVVGNGGNNGHVGSYFLFDELGDLYKVI